MVIRLDNQDIAQAFVDYARKKLDINLDNVASVEFRSSRNGDGYCMVLYTNLLHIHPEMEVTKITLSSFDMAPQPQERKRTAVIPTAPIAPAPPFLFGKSRPIVDPNNVK